MIRSQERLLLMEILTLVLRLFYPNKSHKNLAFSLRYIPHLHIMKKFEPLPLVVGCNFYPIAIGIQRGGPGDDHGLGIARDTDACRN